MAGFLSFDGSKLSPIEEASLILNSPIENLFITPVSEKFQSFDGSKFSPIEEAVLLLNTPIDDLFIYPVSAGNGSAEMCHLRDANADQTQQVQLSPTKCFDPWSHEAVTPGEVHSFDGSKFSPIEEAFLILNGPDANELQGTPDFCSLSEVELLDENMQAKGLDKTIKLQRELLEIKAQIKQLGWLLESSLKTTDMMLPKVAIQNVLLAC